MIYDNYGYNRTANISSFSKKVENVFSCIDRHEQNGYNSKVDLHMFQLF